MAITHFFSRSEETLRRDKAEKERENWRKTLELKCDKLMEDNRELKELLKITEDGGNKNFSYIWCNVM